jgi:hypothetical protein
MDQSRRCINFINQLNYKKRLILQICSGIFFLLSLDNMAIVNAQEHVHEEAFIPGYYRLPQETIYLELPFELILVFPLAYTPNTQLIVPQDFMTIDFEVLRNPVPSISKNENGLTLEYRYVLQAKRSGVIAIDSFGVRTEQQYSRIAPFFVEVASLKEKGDLAPRLVWQGIPQTVYQGESFEAELLLINVHESWQVLHPPQVSARGLITEETLPYVQSVQYQNAPALRLGRWSFFAGQAGSAQIAEVIVAISTLRFATSAVQVSVLNLPTAGQPEDFDAGAIGNFSLRLLYDPPNEDDRIRVRVQLSGEGALHLVRLPALAYEGLQLIDKESLNLIQPSEHGYSGTREENYLLQSEDFQDVSLHLEAFSWFNPVTARYHQEEEQHISFISKKAPFHASSHLTLLPMHGVVGSLGVLDMKIYLVALALWSLATLVVIGSCKFRKKQSLQFFHINMPTLLLALLFLPASWPREPSSTLQEASFALEQEQWQVAINKLELALEMPRYASLQGILYYNMAIAHHQLDNSLEKRFYLLKAAQIAPISNFFLQAAQQEGLDTFVSSRYYEHRIFIWLYWLAWLSLLLFWLKFNKNSLTWAKSMIYLFMTLSVLSLALLALHRRQPRVAVVTADVKALRIPDERATYGESLLRGQIFYVGGSGRDYVQLSNKAGKEGWVSGEYVWLLWP